ncbi:MAG: cysteine synthase family protein [bacterium]|nr:cysteine synthase family protein [bacterium]
MPVYASVIDCIGHTPLVDVGVLSPNPAVRILAKLEGQNPGGSVKDRVARSMTEAAEAAGTLRPATTILEPSSGNTGIALALIARLRGYPVKVVLPENVSSERRDLLEIYGAEIIDSPGPEGSNGAVRRAERLAAEHSEWAYLCQYANDANPLAHYRTTGPEILADCGDITHFVAGLGTAGTLMGVGRYLKEHKPGVKVYAVEPPAGEKVEGLRSLADGYIPPVYENWGGDELLDGKRIVRTREALAYTRRLATEASVFAGISSGAALAGACRVAERIEEGVIVVVAADGGWKYLSTRAWSDPVDEVAERAEGIIYF